jgi:integrase
MPGSRRAKGEGKIERLPSGLYRCRIILNGKTISGESLPTRAAAAKSAREAVESAKRNGAPLAKGRSWSTFARDWVAARFRLGVITDTTAETEGYWCAYIEGDSIGLKDVSKLTAHDLNGWRDRLGVSVNTSHNICGWVNQMMRAAGNDARVDVPAKVKSRRRPMSPTERDKWYKLIDTLDDETFRMAAIGDGTGMRRSEVCGLRHDDRDGDGVWINRVVVTVKGKIIVREKAKNPDSHSWVPIPPHLDALIGHGKKGYVVSGSEVVPNPKALSGRLDEALRGHDLKAIPFFGMHTARRTYGMVQLESGVDPVTAASNMRHSVKMLLEEYARTRRDLKTSAATDAFKDRPTVSDRVRKEGKKA